MVENRMKDRKLFLGVNVDCNPVHTFLVNVSAIGLYKHVTLAEAKAPFPPLLSCITSALFPFNTSSFILSLHARGQACDMRGGGSNTS
jgi:hypothetical protein